MSKSIVIQSHNEDSKGQKAAKGLNHSHIARVVKLCNIINANVCVCAYCVLKVEINTTRVNSVWEGLIWLGVGKRKKKRNTWVNTDVLVLFVELGGKLKNIFIYY